MTEPAARPNLLPARATPRERAIGAADAAVDDLDTDLIRRVGGPDIAQVPASPPEYLSARAQFRSVDVWDPLWPDAVKRAAIVAAPGIHRRKGTPYAVKASLAALGVDCTISEWWQTSPRGAPYTFTVRAVAHARLYGGPVLDMRLQRVVFATILRTKPESRAFDLEIAARLTTQLGLGARVRPQIRVALATVPALPG